MQHRKFWRKEEGAMKGVGGSRGKIIYETKKKKILLLRGTILVDDNGEE